MKKYSDEVEAADALKEVYNKLNNDISKIIIGQDEVVRLVLISIFCKGHSLLVGVPGLAKTLLVSTISQVLDLDFKRIQFTPDLMPSDITGSETLAADRSFKFVKGPVFANIVLADEINRTPPKTQASLLEAMQEKSVTISGVRYPLEAPFFVLATQNPVEQEGTYPLPEAQLDRFMFNIILDYPAYADEVNIVKNTTKGKTDTLKPIISAEEIIYFQELIEQVPVPDNVVEYAVNLVHKTRPKGERAADITKDLIDWGAGPRASQFLIVGAKCNALLHGKYSPDIEDVQAVALPILRHRLIKNFKAEAENVSIDDIIKKLL